MTRYFKTIFVNVTPFIIMLAAAYLVGSFLNVSWNPVDWEPEARIVMAFWGVGFGFALYMRLQFESLV
jgi:hypothetical protein